MNPKTLVKIIVTLGLVALVIKLGGPRRIAGAFQAADYRLILMALLLTPVVILLKACRWHLLARARIKDLKFGPSFKSYMAGLTLAVVTPGSAGELARGYHLDSKHGLELTGLVTVDKLLDLSAVGTCACLGFVYLYGPAIRIACIAAIAGMIVGWLLLHPLTTVVEKLFRAAPNSRIGRFLAAGKGVPIPLILKCLAVALLNFGVYYLQMYLVVCAFAHHAVGLSAAAWFPTITLATFFPLAIGGLGPRELAGQVLLPRYDIHITEAAAASALFAHHIIIMILPGLLGALWVGRVALKDDCGLRTADCGSEKEQFNPKSRIQNPKSPQETP